MHDVRESQAGRGGAALRVAIFLLFFSSGAAGLIYEVAWSRLLTYTFGATLLAVSTVLASFMGGLALGSFLLGRVADRVKRPLRLYAFLELGIAIGALAVPWLLRGLEPLNRLALGDFTSPFALRTLYMFAVNFGVLLIPTTLMGATLPVLSRFMVHRRDSLGLNVGGLYAANTFGAVAGAFCCGFFLILALGVWGAQFFAAGLNFLVFVVALILSRRLERTEAVVEAAEESPGQDVPAPARRLYKVALWTYGVSGFAALSYQVVWTRGLIFCTETLKGATYSFSAMLTVFLAGLAIGSAITTGWVDRHKSPGRLYALLLMTLGLSSGLSGILMFNIAPAWFPYEQFLSEGSTYVPFHLSILDMFTKAVLVMGLPTLLMGMAFPVAARLCVPDLKRVGGSVGRLYAFNTVGAIVGSFASGFVLIPLLGLSHTILLLSAISMLLAVIVFFADPDCPKATRVVFTLVAVAAVALFAIRLPARDETFRNTVTSERKILAFKEGPLATVSVTENWLGHREILVDNTGVAGTSRIMLTDQKSLAHLPSLLIDDPKSALTVGFGSGGASYSYTLHPELEKIHCVEIARTILRRDIQDLLLESNHGILNMMDAGEVPQYDIILADARSYLRLTEQDCSPMARHCGRPPIANSSSFVPSASNTSIASSPPT